MVTITNVAVVTAKYLFGMCDCILSRYLHRQFFACAGNFAHMWTCTFVIVCVSGHGLLSGQDVEVAHRQAWRER